jgi:hypothetical protein
MLFTSLGEKKDGGARMRYRLLLTRCGFSLALLCTACKKTQSPAQQKALDVVPAAPATATEPAAPATGTQLVLTSTHFTGEIRRGQQFEKSFAMNMIFRLEPYAGNDSGWSIRIVPGADVASAAMDCIGAIEEPAHGNTKLAIDPPGDVAGQTPFWKQREFSFIGNAADCKTAWELMNDANYGTKLSDQEREEASTKLSKIPTQHGAFRVIDAAFGPRTPANEQGTIEELKFEVELGESIGTAQKSTTP